MIELYHFGFSTCSQKVRLVLAEKGVEFSSHEINLMAGEQHDPEYVKRNPKHVVPTLVHDGRVYVESSLIVMYLDDAFPEPAMRPDDATGRYRVDAWLMHLDQALHPAAPIVTFALGPRRALLQQPADVREANIAAIPDPVERATPRSVVDHGVQAPEFAGALRVFLDSLDRSDGVGAGRGAVAIRLDVRARRSLAASLRAVARAPGAGPGPGAFGASPRRRLAGSREGAAELRCRGGCLDRVGGRRDDAREWQGGLARSRAAHTKHRCLSLRRLKVPRDKRGTSPQSEDFFLFGGLRSLKPGSIPAAEFENLNGFGCLGLVAWESAPLCACGQLMALACHDSQWKPVQSGHSLEPRRGSRIS